MLTKIYIFTLLFLLLTINNVWADDNFYSISDKTLISNNYKIIFNEPINSDQNYSGILIDDLNLYIHTNKNFYIINKTTGDISFQLMISNIINQVQTDNYIYLQTNYNIYKINKSSGSIDEKRIYINSLKNIYTFFGVSGISGTIINNYYTCGNCTNGTNGTNGIDGINGINGTNGINGSSNLGSAVDYFLHTGSNMTRQFNISSPIQSISFPSSANGVHFVGNWTSTPLNITFMPHGVYEMHFDANKTGGSGTHKVYAYFELRLIDGGGNVTFLGTSELSNEILLSTETEIDADLLIEDMNINTTDVIKMSVYYIQSGAGLTPTVNFGYDSHTDSRLSIPASQLDISAILTNVSQLQTDVSGKVNKSGDTMTGPLILPEIGSGTERFLFDGNSLYYNSNGVTIIEHKVGYPLKITTNLDMKSNNIINCANCNIGPTSRNISTHALNTVYHNTNNTSRWVIVSPTVALGDIVAYVSTNATPSTWIGSASPTTNSRPQLSFWVLPGEYYKVTATGSIQIYLWVEWN